MIARIVTDHPPPQPPAQKPPEESPFEPAIRAGKRFLLPFMISWGLTYVGSQRDLEWLYFAGMAGVTVSMLGLLVWLLH